MRINSVISPYFIRQVSAHKGAERVEPVRPRAQREEPGAVFTKSDETDFGEVDYSKRLQRPKSGQESPQEEQTADKAKSTEKGADGKPLEPEEQRQVQDLRRRDQEVRTHEQSHVAAAGAFARGGAKLEFSQGPDGKRYATAGHVNIDAGEEATPEKTIQKMQVVRRAALAPAQPSATDQAVAQRAATREQAARQELLKEQREEAEGSAEAPDAIKAEAKSKDAKETSELYPKAENEQDEKPSKPKGIGDYEKSAPAPKTERADQRRSFRIFA